MKFEWVIQQSKPYFYNDLVFTLIFLEITHICQHNNTIRLYSTFKNF